MGSPRFGGVSILASNSNNCIYVLLCDREGIDSPFDGLVIDEKLFQDWYCVPYQV